MSNRHYADLDARRQAIQRERAIMWHRARNDRVVLQRLLEDSVNRPEAIGLLESEQLALRNALRLVLSALETLP